MFVIKPDGSCHSCRLNPVLILGGDGFGQTDSETIKKAKIVKFRRNGRK